MNEATTPATGSTHDSPVLYHELRPAQIRGRRELVPVAYLGLGVLEWHGLHNPLGLDGIKAQALCEVLAREIGGIVMPTLYWGDNRREIAELAFDPTVNPWLPKGFPDQTPEIEAESGVPKRSVEADAVRSDADGGWRFWRELVRRILFQIQTQGYRAVVVVPGHYPLFGPLREAIADYEARGGTLTSFVLTDRLYADDGKSGDHAAAFETSVLLALRPELVDLSTLGSDLSTPPIGVLGKDPRVGASAEFGWKIVRKMTSIVRSWLEPFIGPPSGPTVSAQSTR